MTETPCVFIDVQRGGPSTGLPTLPAQADMMQVKWGSHGDYEIIALCPNSPQECFDLTIKAFNLAEKYRVPVFVMMDEVVGHMTEKVVIPPAEEIEVEPRHWTTKRQERVPALWPVRRRTGPGDGQGRGWLQVARHRSDPRRARLSQHDSRRAGHAGEAFGRQDSRQCRKICLYRSRRTSKTRTLWWSAMASLRGSRSARSRWLAPRD